MFLSFLALLQQSASVVVVVAASRVSVKSFDERGKKKKRAVAGESPGTSGAVRRDQVAVFVFVPQYHRNV